MIMKILVFSDSHGDAESMRKLIERIEPETVFYLGDGMDDILSLQEELPALRFEIVKGNCDTVYGMPGEKLISVGGFSFLLTHGDSHFEILEKEEITKYARDKGASVFLHGHTHIPALWTANGITVMNPGTVRNKHGVNYPTCGLIKTYEKHFVCRILFNAHWV